MENVTNDTGESPGSDDDVGHPLNPALSYTLASLLILTTIFTFLGNVLVITIIARSPKIQNITAGFLLNLAIADLSTGLLLIPFATDIQVMRAWTYSAEWCSMMGFIYMALGIVSTWTLASLSMERFIAVIYPLKYHLLLNKTRAIVVVAMNWVLALFLATVPYMAQSGYVYLPNYGFCLPDLYTNGVASIMIMTVGICLPFVLMCLAYLFIGRVACTQARRKVIECNEEHCAYVTPKTKDYRAAKILAALAGVFAVCWLPFTFLCCWTTSVNGGGWGAPPLLTSLTFWLSLLSSAINPWLYSILNRAFRTATRQLLSQAWGKITSLRNHFRVGPTTRPQTTQNHLQRGAGRGKVGGGGSSVPAGNVGGDKGSGNEEDNVGRGSDIEMSEHKVSPIQQVDEVVQGEGEVKNSGSTKCSSNSSKLSVALDETNTVITSLSSPTPQPPSSEKLSEAGENYDVGSAIAMRKQSSQELSGSEEHNIIDVGNSARLPSNEKHLESGEYAMDNTNSTTILSEEEV